MQSRSERERIRLQGVYLADEVAAHQVIHSKNLKLKDEPKKEEEVKDDTKLS